MYYDVDGTGRGVPFSDAWDDPDYLRNIAHPSQEFKHTRETMLKTESVSITTAIPVFCILFHLYVGYGAFSRLKEGIAKKNAANSIY